MVADVPPSPHALSPERYTSAAFLERERTRAFAAGWIAVARERDVSDPGRFRCFDELGVALLVMRDASGGVGVFHNRCRHRGTRLVDGSGRADAVVCPYHGWRYGLDGSLEKAPGSGGLPAAALAGGLAAARSGRALGLVWVNLDGAAPPLEAYLGDLPARLAPYAQDDLVPVDERAIEIPCNWKAFLDNTNELYHLPAVHPRSVGRLEIATKLVPLGRHYELVLTPRGSRLGRLGRLADAWTLPAGWRGGAQAAPAGVEGAARFRKLLVFPNTLINVLPYHTTVYRVFPLGPHRCRVHYGFYRPRRTGVLGRARAQLAGWLSRRVLREDFPVMERFQRGVAAEGPGPLWLHPSREEALAHFHAALDAQLAGSSSPPVAGSSFRP